jgi:glycosyltransferase involved in cell wall biosynthesis
VVSNTLAFPHGAVAAALEHVPHVWYVHEFGREGGHLGPMLYGDPCSFGLMGVLSQRVIANSEAVAQKLRRYIPTNKVRVVYYAVEVPELSPPARSENGEFRLLTLGRTTVGKGQEDSVRATAILADLGVDVQLALVGGGQNAYRRQLAELVSESPARGRVVFHDSTPSPFAYLAEADVYLMTSRFEAFGRVTIEAMKAARPVVATRSGGNVELVRDGWNGLLYRPGDPDDLARQLKRLHDDRALASELGANAAAWAQETFTLERYRDQLLAVLSEAANAGGYSAGPHSQEGGKYAGCARV